MADGRVGKLIEEARDKNDEAELFTRSRQPESWGDQADPDSHPGPAEDSGYAALVKSVLEQTLDQLNACDGVVFQYEPLRASLRAVRTARSSDVGARDLLCQFSDRPHPISVAEWPLWGRLERGEICIRRPGSPFPEGAAFPLFEDWHLQHRHTLCLHSCLFIADQQVGWVTVSFCDETRVDERLLRSFRLLAHELSLVLELKQVSESEREHIARRAIFDERNRIARDMHDVLAHSYTAVLMQLEAATELLPTKPDVVRECLSRATESARRGLRQSRETVLMLQETFLEALPDSISALVAEWGQTRTAQCAFSLTGVPRRLPAEVERQIFRVCQEALSNAQMHAEAVNIFVKLCFSKDAVTASVSDDGRGFHLGEVSDLGFGISSMKKRAERIGAELDLRSGQGQGTTICLKWMNQNLILPEHRDGVGVLSQAEM